jgi:hypothetical protein
MKKEGALVLLSVALCCWVPQAAAQQWTRLIDSRVVYPGIGQFSRCYDVCFDGTSIAFSGVLSNGLTGVFRYSTASDQLQELAVVGDSMPGSPSHAFEQFGVPTINNGIVAFYGDVNPVLYSGPIGFGGVYEQVSPTAPLTRVVDSTSGIGTYFDVGDRPAIDSNGTIAFVSDYQNLYTYDSSGYHFILGANTQIPGDTQDFDFISKPTIENGQIVFMGDGGSGSTPTEEGVYSWQNGNLRTVVNGETTLPGGGTFQLEGTDDRLFTLSGSSIQFYGYISSSQLAGYIETSPGQLQRAYATGDPFPGVPGLTIGGSYYQAYDQDLGVYDLTTSNPSVFGIYYQIGDGSLLPLLTDSVFDGRQLSQLQLVAGSFEDGEIAVDASFSDGSSGVYLISVPVPEPATFAMACVLCIVPLTRRFGRSMTD